MQQYAGSRVAGFTPDQQAAFSNVENAQGVFAPYINAASQYAAAGANPLSIGSVPKVSASAIGPAPTVGTSNVNYAGYNPTQFNQAGLSQFYDPYQQSVIDSTLSNINRNNQLQQSQLMGQAISSGASPFGGDRAGLAAAELARNQDMATNQTIAGLESQGYGTALGAYQNQQGLNTQAGLQNAQGGLTAAQANAANRLAASGQNSANYLTRAQANAANQIAVSGQNAGNFLNNAQNNASRAANAANQYAALGQQAQSNALTGASALLQTGQLQQQQGQQQLDIPYQNFQQQQQYPEQQAQYLISALEGIPINLGSSTTQPSGNSISSVLGGLLGLGGLFKKKGGSVRGFADGGGMIGIPMLDESMFSGYGPSYSDISPMTSTAAVGVPSVIANSPGTISGVPVLRSTPPVNGGIVGTPIAKPAPLPSPQPTPIPTPPPIIKPPVGTPPIGTPPPAPPPIDGTPIVKDPSKPPGLGGTPPIGTPPPSPPPIGGVPPIGTPPTPIPTPPPTPVPPPSDTGFKQPWLDPSKFTYKGKQVDWNKGYVNALPQIPVAAAPKPVVTNLPKNLQTAINNMPPWMMQYTTKVPEKKTKRGGIADFDDGGSPADLGFDPKPLGDLKSVYAAGLGDSMVAEKPALGAPSKADDSLDQHPVVDLSKKTIHVHYPSDNTSIDTGIPVPAPAKSTGLFPNANVPMMAAGAAMMAGTSPFALQNIGAGALTGIEAYAKERQQNAASALQQQQFAAEQSRADRAAALDEKKFNADQSYRQDQTALDREKLNAPTDAVQNAKAMGLQPGTPEFDAYLKSVTVPAARGTTEADISAAQNIADGVVRGDIPPDLKGMYRFKAPVESILADKGINLSRLQTDWASTQRAYSSMNSNQQLRLRQNIDTVKHTLGTIRDLSEQWNAGGYPLLNAATREAALQGALGPEANKIANLLQAQIADVTGEMGSVLMGGNAPTDHAMELASKNLSADWSYPTITAALDQFDQNIAFRENAIANVGAAGVPDSKYNYAKPSNETGPDVEIGEKPKKSDAAAPAVVAPVAPSSAVPEGATATNPKTGEKLIFRGGQWVPM